MTLYAGRNAVNVMFTAGVNGGWGGAESGHAPTYGGWINHLYHGDNLRVLRESIKDETVDLIYLDPPFNSNASYDVLFKGPAGTDSAAQIEAFDDTWHWNDIAEEAFGEVVRGRNAAAAEIFSRMLGFQKPTANERADA